MAASKFWDIFTLLNRAPAVHHAGESASKSSLSSLICGRARHNLFSPSSLNPSSSSSAFADSLTDLLEKQRSLGDEEGDDLNGRKVAGKERTRIHYPPSLKERGKKDNGRFAVCELWRGVCIIIQNIWPGQRLYGSGLRSN